MHTDEQVLLPMRHEEAPAFLGESLSFSALPPPPVTLFLHSYTALNILNNMISDIVTPIPVVNGVINVDLDELMDSLTYIEKPANLDPMRSILFDFAIENPQFQLVGTIDLVGLPPPAWF